MTLQWNERRHDAGSSTHTAVSGDRVYVIDEWRHEFPYAAMRVYNADHEVIASFDNFATVNEAKKQADEWDWENPGAHPSLPR